MCMYGGSCKVGWLFLYSLNELSTVMSWVFAMEVAIAMYVARAVCVLLVYGSTETEGVLLNILWYNLNSYDLTHINT